MPTHTWEVALAYVAALGSVMVSYTRARAEGLGLTLKTGLMARPERVLLLAGGLIIGGAGWLVWTLLLLAVTSVFTSAQRIVDVARMLARERVADGATDSATGGVDGSRDGSFAGTNSGARTATTPSSHAISANGHATQSSYSSTTQHVPPESTSSARPRGASGPAN